jgi:Malectin domain
MRIIPPFVVVALCSLVEALNFPSFLNNNVTKFSRVNHTQVIPSEPDRDQWNVPGISTLFRPATLTTTVSSVHNFMVETFQLPPTITEEATISSPQLPLETEVRAAVPFAPLRVNIGGPQLVDTQGRTWIADRYYTGGNVYTDGRFDVRGTSDSALFQSERNGMFQYEVPLPVVGSYLFSW